jgi:hypothetical protein
MYDFFVGNSKKYYYSITYKQINLCINCGLNMHLLWSIL